MQVKEMFIWELNERKRHARLRQFRYSRTITSSVANQNEGFGLVH